MYSITTWDMIWLIALISVLTGFVLLLLNRKKKIVLSNASEFLCLLKENKIFPIFGNEHWYMEGVSDGLRRWRRTLESEYQKASVDVAASYAVINRSFEVVEAVLKNCKAKNQWNSNVPSNCNFRTYSYHPDDKGCSDVSYTRRRYSLESEGYTKEVVRLDKKSLNFVYSDWMTFLKNWVVTRAESIIRAKNFERCWNKTSDKEFWLIENSLNFKSYVLYLLNRNGTSGDSSCLLTILVGKNSSIYWNIPNWVKFVTSFPEDCPSRLLVGLNDFLTLDAVGSSQTLHLSDEVESLPSTDAHSASSAVSDLGSLRRKAQLGKPVEQPEISFFQRIKNMLDDKKEEESKPRKRSLLTGEFQNQIDSNKKELDSPINPIDIIKRFSISAKFFDEKKTESDTSLSENSKDNTPPPRKRWSLQTEGIGKSSENKKFLHKSPLAASSDHISNVDADLLQCLETMIDNAALEIISEKCKVANLDIKAKSEDQAAQSGGWIYCGLEKDTVILKKISNDDNVPLHSYIGKGVVSHPPKLVYEVLRCPTRRVAYDDMVKNVEILKELEGGMKIVRLLYEVGQNFRRELREFIVLQGERIEGMKHVITLQSVDWNNLNSSFNTAQTPPSDSNNSLSRRNSLEMKNKPCNPAVGVKEGRSKVAKLTKQSQLQEGVVSAKMFSSGWIIEPVLKANKLCSMITYISQMKLDTGMKTALSYLAEDIALKQPLCIVHLRNYLTNLDAEEEFLSDVDCKRSGKSVTLSITNALARFRNHQPSDRNEEGDHDIVV